VKAEAESDLMASFEAICWRPGMIDGKGPSSQTGVVDALRPVMRALLKWFRGLYVMNVDIGRAMLQGTKEQVRSRIIENAELRTFADRYRGLS
jgi:hypothetical protein